MTIGMKIAGGFALSLAVLAGIGGYAYYCITQLSDSEGFVVKTDERVSHTHEVLQNLEALLGQLTQAESGQRGYLLTGEDAFLAPYTQARAHIDQTLAHVKELTRANA